LWDHDKTRPPCDDAKIGTPTQRRVINTPPDGRFRTVTVTRLSQ
jgi:hypothetical protein